MNLGPINIDSYGTGANNEQNIASGPNIPACSYTNPASNYRTCMQAVLGSYGQQGVIGVRFQFDMNGLGSTPFTDVSGTPSTAWQNNLSLFLQDLRAANIRYVSFTPGWLTYGTGNMSIYACVTPSASGGGPYTYNFGCNTSNANAVFYPWLPWGLTYCPPNTPSCGNSNPWGSQGGPFDAHSHAAYFDNPQLGAPTTPPGSPQPWRWTSSDKNAPMFKFWDFIFGAVANAQLQVHEVDLVAEIPIWLSSVFGRLVFDNVQLVRPLDVIDQIMVNHGLSPAATFSTQAFQPSYTSSKTPCNSPSGDSFLVAPAYLLLSAQTGGVFGSVANLGDLCDPPLLSPTDQVDSAPFAAALYPPTVIDIHAYPADAVQDPGWGWIANPNTTACQYYPDGAPVKNVCAAHDQFGNCSYVQNCANDTDGDPASSSKKAATQIYAAINTFVQRWKGYGIIPGPAPVIIGETDEYNPGGIGRDGILFPAMTEGSDCSTFYPYGSNLFDSYADPATQVVHQVNFDCQPDWKWHRPWSTISASENVSGFTATGLNRPDTIIRPWEPVSWGSVFSPGPVSGDPGKPYNVGACGNTITQPLAVPASGGTTSVTVTQTANASCQWSIGPVPPAQPSSAAVQWPAMITSSAINNGSPCNYPAGSCWSTGSGTVSFQIAPNPAQQQRSVQVLVAGNVITLNQAPVGSGIVSGSFYGYGLDPISSSLITVIVDGNQNYNFSAASPYSVVLPPGQHSIGALPDSGSQIFYSLQGAAKVAASTATVTVNSGVTALDWYFLPNTLNLSNMFLGMTGTYAGYSMLSAGPGVTIPNGAGVTFLSSGQIILQNGFHAGGSGTAQGLTFHAAITNKF